MVAIIGTSRHMISKAASLGMRATKSQSHRSSGKGLLIETPRKLGFKDSSCVKLHECIKHK